MSDHLNYATSDRGFDYMPAILGRIRNEQAEVYESSLATEPAVWLAVQAPQSRNHPQLGEPQRVVIELPAEDAWKLADQLRHLVRHHYQGGGPEWLQTYGGTEP